MKQVFSLICAGVLGALLGIGDAEAAKRFGGGASLGKQRSNISREATPQRPAQPPAAAPAPAAQPAAAGGSRWLGPLAGLAAGGLLAALFLGGAFEGINLMDVAVLALLIGGVFFVLRSMRRPAPAAMRYSGVGPGGLGVEPVVTGAGGAAEPVPARVPPGFDVNRFMRNAEITFRRLQASNDAKDLEEMRGYLTAELHAEIARRLGERDPGAQRLEVASLDCSLLDVVSEGDTAVASVRFSGELRDAHGVAETFDEVWHVEKDLRDEKSVWLLAGIQQLV